jgi:cytochrome c-type biogenesis protein CcmE
VAGFWPKSVKARRRLMVFLIAAPVFMAAAGLALYALKDGVVYFYTPAQAIEAKVAAHKAIRLGGLVQAGSVQRLGNGMVEFTVMDKLDSLPVRYQGDLPDLFREGQGVVMEGALDEAGTFVATSVLAKHDEKYMPKEVTKALKEQGEWRPDASGKGV